MNAPLPFAVVGVTWREGATSLREVLRVADEGESSPSAQLLQTGAAVGIVRIATCSRVEWVVAADAPGWAGQLLRAGLIAAAGLEGDRGRAVRVRTGRAAVDHLLRVATGLDAVVEGERSVGGQVLRAFEEAHAQGRTDGRLHGLWRIVGQAVSRRAGLPGATAGGVHTLAVEALKEAGVERTDRVEVLGTGAIARQFCAAWPTARAWPRRELGAFVEASVAARAVVLCTAGPAPWVELPLSAEGQVAVDVGAPRQVVRAEGWNVIDLDALLLQRRWLPDAVQMQLERLVFEGVQSAVDGTNPEARSAILAAIAEETSAYLDREMPPLAATLPREAGEAVRRSMAQLGHRVLRRVKEAKQ